MVSHESELKHALDLFVEGVWDSVKGKHLSDHQNWYKNLSNGDLQKSLFFD